MKFIVQLKKTITNLLKYLELGSDIERVIRHLRQK